jgi:hypothetical protein
MKKVEQRKLEMSKALCRKATDQEVAFALTLDVGGKYQFTAKNLQDARYNPKRVPDMRILKARLESREKKRAKLVQMVESVLELMPQVQSALKELKQMT